VCPERTREVIGLCLSGEDQRGNILQGQERGLVQQVVVAKVLSKADKSRQSKRQKNKCKNTKRVSRDTERWACDVGRAWEGRAVIVIVQAYLGRWGGPGRQGAGAATCR
jgi:hypothetical protein